jgi:hypothetical protein
MITGPPGTSTQLSDRESRIVAAIELLAHGLGAVFYDRF